MGSRPVIESRKQAVSIRMSAADVRKMKKLAARIGTRDSDVIRFAVKCMLARLAPLYDPETRGRGLVPVFVESGAEFMHFFDLDAVRLDAIINDGAQTDERVAREDIALLALAANQEAYAAVRLQALRGGSEEGDRATGRELAQSLREYLYGKYVYRGNGEAHAAAEQAPLNAAALGQ